MIGFTAPGLIPNNIMPLIMAIQEIYLYDKPPRKAVAAAFGGALQALHHTSVVIIECDKDGGPPQSCQFVYAPTGSMPCGLPPPQCPGCLPQGLGIISEVYPTLKHGELGRVRFGCLTCKLRTNGSTMRLDWVQLSGFKSSILSLYPPIPHTTLAPHELESCSPHKPC